MLSVQTLFVPILRFMNKHVTTQGSICRVKLVTPFTHEVKVGFGAVLLPDMEEFKASINGPLNCQFDPYIAEARACREALSWLKGKLRDARRLFCIQIA